MASIEEKKWIEVNFKKHKILQKKFKNQIEVLTYLRESSNEQIDNFLLYLRLYKFMKPEILYSY